MGGRGLWGENECGGVNGKQTKANKQGGGLKWGLKLGNTERTYFLNVPFLFSPFFLTLLATRHIRCFTMFDLISLQPTRNMEINFTS